eukprot:gene159-186_t
MDSSFKTLYAASEVDNSGTNGKHGTIAAFSVGADGDLTILNRLDAEGSLPCYIECAKNDRHVFVANYGCGSVAVFPVADDCALLPASSIVRPVAPLGSPIPEAAAPGSFAHSGHDSTHAHTITTCPSGRFVYATDLAQDRTYIYQLNETTSVLEPAVQPYIDASSLGAGPRHIVFHPTGSHAYIVHEEASTITSYSIDQTTGALSPCQTINMIASNYHGTSFASGIAISSCGRHLYAANRLRNTITHITIDQQSPSTLTWIEETWTRGDFPRSVTIEPTGRFLYSLNQRSDNITRFSIDSVTGRLTFIDDFTSCGSPSQIVFAYSK